MSKDLVVQQKAKSLQSLLQASKGQIEMALPKHLTPDRLLRIALTEARKNPALLDCTQASFIGAIIQTAQLGLEPGGSLGHAYLVPFKNKNAGTTEVQFIVGYRGMIDLAYRSPRVKKIIARAVYDKDKFSYDFGLEEKLIHVPAQDGSGDTLTHVYCIVELEGGVKLFDVMSRREVEMAKERAKSEKGPWSTDYEAMAKKTVVRRFFKFMPSSIEMQNAIGMDEAAERGEQFNGAVVEAVGVQVEQPPNTTDKFKEKLGHDEQETPPAKPSGEGQIIAPKKDFPETQGGFSNFNEPVVKPKSNVYDANRGELLIEVTEAAKRAGIEGLKALSERSKKEFGKITSDLTGEELEVFVSILQKEAKS